MRHLARGLITGVAAATIVAAGLPQSASAVQPAPDGSTAEQAAAVAHRPDNRPGPLTRITDARRRAAMAKIAKGTAVPDADGIVALGKGRFVQLSPPKNDTIFTILADFGTQTINRYGTDPGPTHNNIPQPDRSKDNSTYWEPNFDRAYYEDLFNDPDNISMKTYYERLSSGRYSVTNVVTDWVTVPYNASRYGDNAIEDNGGSWAFIDDAGDSWYQSQLDAGRTPAQIDDYLSQFDTWDRYDFDQDGVFDEADGYIDHFQAVHAGEGEEAGASEDAIWSHRWYVNGTDFGVTGPTVGSAPNLAGGARIGGSKYWLGDYTVEPENGGLGVFAHEFGHDLGLIDYYDTAGGENSTAFWTLMSSGSWLSAGTDSGIGTVPGLMGPHEKMLLGWLDYSTVGLGQSATRTINPAQGTVDGLDQAVKVDLPDKTTTTTYVAPYSGSHAWWTGSADSLNETLTRDVPASSRVTVTARAWYDIEDGYDYLYGEYSVDGGKNWLRAGSAITSTSKGSWKQLRFAYKAGGQATKFRFRYQTDGGVHMTGAFLDDISVNGTVDTVDGGAGAWTATGKWKRSTGTESQTTPRYYLLENRAYVGYDALLEVGPYQFDKGYTAPNHVEHFPFQDGMLVWYVDDSFADDNTSEHVGGGWALPVDASPQLLAYPDGSKPSNRRQPFDATFDIDTTDAVCLHKEVYDKKAGVSTVEACLPARPGVATFDDSVEKAYWNELNPWNSVWVAGHGVKATVTSRTADGDLVVSITNPS